MGEQAATLHPATAVDLPQVIALDQALFGWYGAAEDPAIITKRLEIFPEGFVVLKSANRLAGYISTEKWATVRPPALDEDPAITHDPAGTILCITTLAVSPDFQGQGYGRRLLDQVINIARQQGCKKIMLETAHAADFYIRHGFQQIGEREQRDIKLFILQAEVELAGG